MVRYDQLGPFRHPEPHAEQEQLATRRLPRKGYWLEQTLRLRHC